MNTWPNGFKVIVECPHGVSFKAPMRMFYGLDGPKNIPGCLDCNAPAEPKLSRKERKAFERIQRSLRDGDTGRSGDVPGVGDAPGP